MEEQKLTEEELKQMFSLLKRFSETQMDQWELYKFETKYGPVYVDILREILSSEDAYIDVTHLIEESKGTGVCPQCGANNLKIYETKVHCIKCGYKTKEDGT